MAPYYFLKRNDIRDSEDAVNIDIGGGTSDVMFFMQKTGKYLSTSFKFAGSDIWGDGIKDDRKDNGFIKNLLLCNKDIIDKSGKKSLLDSFLTNASYKSEDVISLLFKYDDQYKFTDSIELKKPELRLIFFLHYSAIIYHLVQVIEANDGFSIPRYFTFTGKGSQYLNLMCDEIDLHRFTKLLLKTYTKLELPKVFETKLTDNPKEATANGAVLFITDETAAQITNEQIGDSYVQSGVLPINDNYGNITGTAIGNIISDTNFMNGVLNNVKEYINKTLCDPEIKKFLINDYEIKNLDKYKDFLLNGDEIKGGGIEDSLSSCLKKLELRRDDYVSETFFFLALKDSLYSLSKKIIEQK